MVQRCQNYNHFMFKYLPNKEWPENELRQIFGRINAHRTFWAHAPTNCTCTFIAKGVRIQKCLLFVGQNHTKTLTVEASGSAEQLAGCTSQLVVLLAGVLSSLLSLRRWVEVLPDSNSLNCKCIISKCGWIWEFLTIFGPKNLYNFTLSGQPAAKRQFGLHRQKLDQHGGMSRVVWKLKKLKTNSSRKKFEKVTLTNQKTRSFWRHLRQYLNNIVLPPLKKNQVKKNQWTISINTIAFKKTNPIICNLRKKYKSSEATSKKHTSQN